MREPRVVFDGLLSDVGKDCVGAAEGHKCGFAEKHALCDRGTVPAEPESQGDYRKQPEGDANGGNRDSSA